MEQIYTITPPNIEVRINRELSDVLQWPSLYRTKKLLNDEKHKLDKYYENENEGIYFSNLSDDVRMLDDLRGDNGILVKEYNAQIVTNAYLKMYEAITYIEYIYPSFFRKNEIKTLHLAEAPGNFLLAINHFMKTKYPNITWEWFANTYESKEKSQGYLSDNYGLIKKYRNRWLLGIEGNGDISSPENISSIVEEIGKVDLITSDVKYVPKEQDYDEEENVNKPVQVGHMLATLSCLNIGGVALLKEFTHFETLSVHCLFLLSKCFEQLYLYKPESSRPINSETYILGINFKGCDAQIIQDISYFLNRIRFENNTKPKPGIYESLPKSFFEQINSISFELAKKQINQINMSIDLYNKYDKYYKSGKRNYVVQAFKGKKSKSSSGWIRKRDFKTISKKDYI